METSALQEVNLVVELNYIIQALKLAALVKLFQDLAYLAVEL
jgi:hypothetical protein